MIFIFIIILKSSIIKSIKKIILNIFLSEHRLHRTLKHEIEHIAYRDFESTIDIGIIEAIRHSAIGNNIKKEYRSIDSMKQGA